MTTIRWIGGRGIKYINKYGPKSHPKYQIESTAVDSQYEENPLENQKVSNPFYRYRDQRLDNGKYRYIRRYINNIFGVA